MRLLLTALYRYAWRGAALRCGHGPVECRQPERVAGGRGVRPAAILVGLVFPVIAVALYCLIAVVLVVPVDEVRRLVTRGRLAQ